MLDKIGKTMAVISELRRLPVAERQWVLDECKALCDKRQAEAESDFRTKIGNEQYRAMVRLDTIRVIRRLLGTIQVRF